MNLEFSSGNTAEAKSVVFAQLPESAQRGSRIEPCEFERLLQRAMEVLNARDLQVQLALKNV